MGPRKPRLWPLPQRLPGVGPSGGCSLTRLDPGFRLCLWGPSPGWRRLCASRFPHRGPCRLEVRPGGLPGLGLDPSSLPERRARPSVRRWLPAGSRAPGSRQLPRQHTPRARCRAGPGASGRRPGAGPARLPGQPRFPSFPLPTRPRQNPANPSGGQLHAPISAPRGRGCGADLGRCQANGAHPHLCPPVHAPPWALGRG